MSTTALPKLLGPVVDGEVLVWLLALTDSAIVRAEWH